MQKEKKKVIYYYYDEEGNRRPLDIQLNEGDELMVQTCHIDGVIKRRPNLDNNLYALVDGYEFKLS
ncbi:hypothetical protein [Staphylococcus simulans]|uniref:hypothetical protein n=1 Tax=Staphylococcus simulans TaxID=1286 RepID=UPI0021D4583F|nr:hypothetical protein [Staphylococcus simulans]UXR32351.1 hypothetical protein MUA81_10700 [Staphylococcus simulans]